MKKYEFIKKGEKVLWGSEVVEVMSDLYDCYGIYNEETCEFEACPVSENTDDNDIYVDVKYRHVEGNLCQGTTVDEFRVTDVRANELEEIFHICELSEDDLHDLYNSIRGMGSIYISDYANDCGVPPEEMCDAYEYYLRWVREEFESDDDDVVYSEYNFVDFFLNYY